MPFLRLRTWQWEAAFVAAVLFIVVLATGNSLKEWIGAAAVLLTFMHAQVSDRMAEDQAAKPVPTVDCFSWSTRYFVMKEFLWLAYFLMSQTWSALVGVVIFLAYPAWRKFYRRHRPV